MSAGLIALCTEADNLSPNQGAIYHHFWPTLVNGIILGLEAGPGCGGCVASQAAVAAVSSSTSSVFGDERFTDVTGDASKLRKITIDCMRSEWPSGQERWLKTWRRSALLP